MMVTWESSDYKWYFSAIGLNEMIIAGRGGGGERNKNKI